MNREEALLYVGNWQEWPEDGSIPEKGAPKEWSWWNSGVRVILVHSVHDPITYDDWRKARSITLTTPADGLFANPTLSAQSARLTAPDFLERGAQHMRDRAAQRDKPDGERSMARAVAAFNAQEGTNLTEEQGWRFMIQLKYSRACAGVFVADDYEDMAAYAGLAGEAAQ